MLSSPSTLARGDPEDVPKHLGIVHGTHPGYVTANWPVVAMIRAYDLVTGSLHSAGSRHAASWHVTRGGGPLNLTWLLRFATMPSSWAI
jgi:hypothetical protein